MNKNDKKIKLKIVGIAVFLLLAFGFFLVEKAGNDEGSVIVQDGSGHPVSATSSALDEEKKQEKQEAAEIFVHVDGQVKTPKIAILKDGSRVFEAIDAAGGLTELADTKLLNLAAKLRDGDKLYIPAAGEQPAVGTGSTGSAGTAEGLGSGYGYGINAAGSGGANGSNGLVNINTASSEELQTLTGVGPSTASKIIDYRNSEGGFTAKEDLKNVSGIGDKTYQKFVDKICID